MQRIALFPGTFDPITHGHVDVIRRSAGLFDQIIIGIGVNAAKQTMYTLEQRIEWINEIFREEAHISAAPYSGLTVDFCRQTGARFILRGIRSVGDFEYEKAIADMNRMLAPETETVFLTCSPAYSTVSSTMVRDVIRHGGAASMFVPAEVAHTIGG